MLRSRGIRSVWLVAALVPFVAGMSGCALIPFLDDSGSDVAVGPGSSPQAVPADPREANDAWQWGAQGGSDLIPRDPGFAPRGNGQPGFAGHVRDALARAGLGELGEHGEAASAALAPRGPDESGYISGYRPKRSYGDAVAGRWERLQERLGAGLSFLLPLVIGLLAGGAVLWLLRRYGQVAVAAIAGVLLGGFVVFLGFGVGFMAAFACLAGVAIAALIAFGGPQSKEPPARRPASPPTRVGSARRGVGPRRGAGSARRQGPGSA